MPASNLMINKMAKWRPVSQSDLRNAFGKGREKLGAE